MPKPKIASAEALLNAAFEEVHKRRGNLNTYKAAITTEKTNLTSMASRYAEIQAIIDAFDPLTVDPWEVAFKSKFNLLKEEFLDLRTKAAAGETALSSIAFDEGPPDP